MAKEFTVIIEKDEEGYYIAEVPELKGCHTQAKSLDTLMERVKEAIQLCLEVYGAAECTIGNDIYHKDFSQGGMSFQACQNPFYHVSYISSLNKL
jgi:predicted RNase H-like HicB family nuclease